MKAISIKHINRLIFNEGRYTAVKGRNMNMTVRVSASLCTLLLGMSLSLRADSYVLLTYGGADCVGAGICTAESGATTIDFNASAGQTGIQVFGLATYTPVGFGNPEGSPYVNSSTGTYAAPRVTQPPI